MFELRNLSKSFGAVGAVTGIDITIAPGRTTVLIGPSGCGKSTLIRTMMGLIWPDGGTVRFEGTEVAPANALLLRRRMGYVIQDGGLFPPLTARGNAALMAGYLGWSRQQIEARLGELAVLTQFPREGLDRYPVQLSGGQRQRVALMRALMLDPDVLLLDEPLGALDKKLREQMKFELRALQKSVGITFFFVTHDQEEALTLSDRVAVMSKGRVLQVASPNDLYERPNSRFVADFIGTMNFFEGRVQKSDNGATVIDAGPLGEVKAATVGDVSDAGTDVLVAIRPEKLKLHFEAPVDGANIIEGRMGPTAYLGDRSHFHIIVPGLELPVAVARQNMDGMGQKLASSDQPVWLSFSSESVVLLKSD